MVASHSQAGRREERGGSTAAGRHGSRPWLCALHSYVPRMQSALCVGVDTHVSFTLHVCSVQRCICRSWRSMPRGSTPSPLRSKTRRATRTSRDQPAALPVSPAGSTARDHVVQSMAWSQHGRRPCRAGGAARHATRPFPRTTAPVPCRPARACADGACEGGDPQLTVEPCTPTLLSQPATAAHATDQPPPTNPSSPQTAPARAATRC